MNKETHYSNFLEDNSRSININNPELINYIKKIGKEMALSLKNKKTNSVEFAMEDLLDEFSKINKTGRISNLPLNSSTPEPPKRTDYTSTNYNNSSFSELSSEPLDSMYSYKKKIQQEKKESTSFYERKVQQKANKDLKLKILKTKEIIEKEKQIRSKPKISTITKRIIQKNAYRPIQDRVDEIVESKNLNRENLKKAHQELKLQQEQEYSTSRVMKSQFNPEHFERWRQNRLKWRENKINRILSITQEKERLETEEAKMRSIPMINEYSRIICNSNCDNSTTSVHEKLYKEKDIRMEKLVEKVFDSIPTFTPIITKNIPNFEKNKFNFYALPKETPKEIRSITPTQITGKNLINFDINSYKKTHRVSYKINVRNVSSCMTDQENVIIYKPKYIKKGIK